MSAALVRVAFRGDEILVVEQGEDRWLPLRPLCERFQIDFATQTVKLKTAPWAVVGEIPTTGADGKTYQMTALHLRSFAGWLFSIKPGKVKPEIRDALIAYQKEAAEVLYQHFAPKSQPAPAPQLPADPPPWTLVLQERFEALQRRFDVLEGKLGEPEHDGQIGPGRAQVIKRELLTYGALMGHGDRKAAKSWRTSGDNELRATLKYQGGGRVWARLPVARYGEAMGKLDEMMKRARKVDVAHLEAQQLPLKAS